MSLVKTFTININEYHPDLLHFMKKWHYSKSIPRNIKYYFTMWHEDILIGVACVGVPCGANTAKKYSKSGKAVYELRRLALIDNTPKNSESYFIGHILRWLKKNIEIDGIISYADSEQGHTGVIYKASNFDYLGCPSTTNSRYKIKGKRKWYHSRQMYQYGTKTSNMLILAKKQGKLIRGPQPKKHIYYYGFTK